MSRGADAAVLVAGMHRSGSSAACRVVNLLGVALAPDWDLLGPTPANPRGHWESATLMRLNDRLLSLHGSRWWCPPRRAEGQWSTPAHEALVQGAARTLHELHPESPWAWKDPRLCLTLPFWLPLLPRVTVVILVLRSPLEIAASLARRDGFSPEHGVALWERSLHHLLPALAGLPVATVAYADLIADPRGEAERLHDFLGSQQVKTGAPRGEQIESFVDRQLRSHVDPPGHLLDAPEMNGPRRELAGILASLPARSASFEVPDLPGETPENDRLFLDLRLRAIARGGL